tara:strand:- start:45 stop:548 length:504 start_codon:yes stop_codon:yes gene_type:complete
MSIVEQDSVVSVNYTGTYPQTGEVFDSSEGRDPLTFLVGHKQMILGFEQEMLGATVGETRKFTLTPDEAYGHRDEAATQDVQRSDFPDTVDVEQALEQGIPLGAYNEEGQPMQFRIVAIEGDIVKIDFNHPMAGETLNFSVDVVAIREATSEELEHGHVHGPGGHHH